MARAWQDPRPVPPVVDPRPGALLGAAAAVPAGAAVLLAAGLLPSGARIALGIALVVLGLRLRAEARTVLGARVGPATARAAGLATAVVGVVVTAGAAAVGLFDLLGTTAPADGFADRGTLGAGPAIVVALVVLAVGGALLRGVGAGTAAGPADDADPAAGGGPGAGDATWRAVAVVLSGLGGALLVPLVLGPDVLALGDGARTVLVLAAAVAAAVLGVRLAGNGSRAPGSSEDVGRALLLASAVLVATTGGEATQILAGVVGPVSGPSLGSPEGDLAVGLRTAVAALVAAGLLVVAVRWRDPVCGVVPVGLLLVTVPTDGAAAELGALVVPVGALLLASLAAAGRTWAARLGSPAALRVAAGAAALLVAAQAAVVLPGPREGSDVAVVGLLAAAAGLLVTLGLVAVARTAADRAGAAAAVVLLVGLVAISPLTTAQTSGPESWARSIPVALVVWLATVAIVAAVLQRRDEALVRAAATLVVASATAQLAAVVAFRDGAEPGDLGLVLVVQIGPAAVLLLAAAAAALLGRPAVVAAAQVVGGAAALAGALAVVGGATLTRQVALTAPGPAVLDGGALVLALLVLVVLAAGAALLAASTARRVSAPVATATVGATLAVAVLVGAVGLAAVDGTTRPVEGDVPLARTPAAATDLALGLRTVAGTAREVGAGWPLLLGALAAVLLAAAWFLESWRPVPPGAPLG